MNASVFDKYTPFERNDYLIGTPDATRAVTANYYSYGTTHYIRFYYRDEASRQEAIAMAIAIYDKILETATNPQLIKRMQEYKEEMEKRKNEIVL